MANFVLAGGGTAGHVNPLLATATELLGRGHTVVALGTAAGLEAQLVPPTGIPLKFVPRVPFPRRPSMDLFALPLNLLRAMNAAGKVIDEAKADAVVGFGGYVSTPAYFAAWIRGIPLVVHEANARPGIANRVGARLSKHVATTFPETPLPRARVTGLPLRDEISVLADVLHDPVSRQRKRAAAREKLGWNPDVRAVLVTGGSLGAASLNRTVVESIEELTQHGLHVLHLTGKGKSAEAVAAKAALDVRLREAYVVAEYATDMAAAFAAVDAVVCRAGAATVSEITALGLPALYVPLPIGNGEQALNAKPAVDAGAALLIDDNRLTDVTLVQSIEHMVLDPHAHESMHASAMAMGASDGAVLLANLCEEAAS